MSNFRSKYRKQFLDDKKLRRTTIFALLFLVVSFFVNFYAGTYATREASNSVTDLILNNIRVFDVDGIYVYGFLAFCVFAASFCAFEPKRIPFFAKSVALFTITRSLFVVLTHIGPFPSQLNIDSILFSKFSFTADLFFSAHTGLPFLMALIFWESKRFRVLFIALSVFFAVAVLLGHLHYSIDVVAAYFITYTIFHVSRTIFKKDQEMFLAQDSD